MEALELTPFQKKVSELILNTPAPGKHAARSAIQHIQKAWLLRDTDREMAAFRAITGEEGSVTALFHSLVRRGYEGATRFNRWKHQHKWAVPAFLRAVADVLRRAVPQFEPKWEISEVDGKERVRLLFRLPGTNQWVTPVLPLNMDMKVNGKTHDFAPELAKIASDAKVKDIQKFIDELANLRNQILYAAPHGVPRIEHDMADSLLKRRNKIFNNLTLYLMIDPYPERQMLVQNCVDALLRVLVKVKPPKEPSEPEKPTSGDQGAVATLTASEAPDAP